MASYPIPEWLKPRGDPGAEFTAAYHAGASVAMEQQRLQAEQQRSAMAAAERAQIAQQDALVQQQKIEVDKAYNQAQIGLRKQQLDQAQQKITQTAQSAARRFQAQSQIKSAIAAGMPADEAYLKFGADAFTSMAGVAPLIKQHQARVNPTPPKDIVPKIFTDPSGKQIVYNPATGAAVRSQAEDKGPTVSAPLTDNPFGPKISGRLSDPNVRRALGTNAPPIAGEPSAGVSPLPGKKADLVKGQKYQTPRGVATWDGDKFVRE